MQTYVDKVREFNRYYTNALGLLNAHFLNSKYSLTEARILYEIGSTDLCTASSLVQLFSIDKGYLSRTLKQLERNGMIIRKKSKEDTRVLMLTLSKKGKQELAELNNVSNAQIANLMKRASAFEISELVSAMDTIRQTLSGKEASFSIRESKAGDLGYIIHRHALLYEAEYEFNDTFEHYVINGISDFLKNRSDLDKVWVAESNDRIIGAIGIIHSENKSAQLRWFYSEPSYRNLGVGKKLLTTAIEYSRQHFSQLSLWTLSHLEAARNLYDRFNFILTDSKQNDIWKPGLIEERWELKL
ncbi:putative HTH-type DNA-binding domain-containing acetyltransferase YbfA [Leptospira kobayashii]|uniref:HTH-type DNA-binding domain-containing acetyltransferase YbfA n=1 Tax=Leptospira kobayashii TaxID=1917830 RepID=A0ABN6KKA0_9LEPT|nr:helix-turn-helix domain-containing GNAT family N-acetyltransferase [Leptospira kobayashii]BDA80366.1 putative HTH-type DNA-binding domain-containing acetyltransferase YbfA [Leptospira kobayashii]